MGSNTPLTPADRSSWLQRICGRARETLFDLENDNVIISCSALTSAYRTVLRETLHDWNINVVFIDLQAGSDVLTDRLQKRIGHYMTANMVDGQVQLHETATVHEADVFPVDAEMERTEVLGQVKRYVSNILAEYLVV